MNQPGLDGRHRDRDGRIDQKHSNVLNRHLSKPIPEFGLDVTLKQMRDATGKVSEADVRAEAKRLAAVGQLQGRFTAAQYRAALAILAERKRAVAATAARPPAKTFTPEQLRAAVQRYVEKKNRDKR